MDILNKIKAIINSNLNNKEYLVKVLEDFVKTPLKVEDFESVYVPNDMMNRLDKDYGKENVIKHFKSETSLKMFVVDFLSREALLHTEDLKKILEVALSNSATSFIKKLDEEPKENNSSEVDNVFNKPRGPLN